jgi:hypothetical protein
LMIVAGSAKAVSMPQALPGSVASGSESQHMRY